MAANVLKYYCGYNALMGYNMGCIPQINGRKKLYYMKYTYVIAERIIQCDSYVAWNVGVWHCQQHNFYLKKCRVSSKWLHQGIKGYSSNQQSSPHRYGKKQNQNHMWLSLQYYVS